MDKRVINPLISVIVPVYNVEQYIHRCIDSIVNQTYSNIEIVLVDDASPDCCGEICDDYAKLNNKITVIHKQNGGLASARNAGVHVAKGDYICFVDSDDWIEKDTLEYCVNLVNAEKDTVDIVQYGVATVSSFDDVVKSKSQAIKKLRGKDILNYLMVKSIKTDSYFSVCRCIYAAHLVKNETFPEGRVNEDIVYKYRILSKASYMIDTNQIKYFYFQGTGSITTDGFKKRDLDLCVAAEELNRLTQEETYGRIRKMGKVKYARSGFSLLCKIAYYGIADKDINKKETVKAFQKDLRHNYFLLIFSPMTFSRKVLATLFCINFKLTEKIVQLAKRFLK